MTFKVFNLIRIVLLLVFLAAAAATPTLAEAKTAHASKKRTSKKPVKKMKLVFDGSPSSTANEPLRPQVSQRSLDLPGETVHLRGGSIDDLWTTAPKPIRKTALRVPKNKKVAVAVKPPLPPLAKPILVAARATPRPRVELERPVPREIPAKPYVAAAASLRPVRTQSSPFIYSIALENTLTMGRTYELKEEGGRNFALRNELFLGAADAGGWGLKISASFNSTSNADVSKDMREFGDPSIIISHPSFYKDETIDLYGRARYYAPVSSSSSASGLHHFAYYLLADVTLPSQMAVSNAFIPRYFVQDQYAETDAYSLVYDSTEFTKQLNSSFRIGVGQQTQIEMHQASANGTTIEAYPFLDFIGISNTLLQAKVYLPLYVNGAVGGAPAAAGLSNLQAEFFAKISF